MLRNLLSISCICFCIVSNAQVGIGTTSPDPAAMLDINAQIVPGLYGGLKLPTVTLAQRAAIATPIPDGLMVYVADNPIRCLQVYDAVQAAWMNVYCMNQVPVASGVDFTGTLQVNQILTATYTYSDFEGNTEFGTTFQWYRATNAAGAGRTAIGGATNATYTTTSADIGFFVAVGVTPRAGTGASPGVEVLSAYKEIASTAVPVRIAIQDFEVTPATPTLFYSTNSVGNFRTTDGPFPNSPAFLDARSYSLSNGNAVLTFGSLNTTAHTSSTLKMRIASFSVTSNNGAEEADFVEIEISTDNGATFSKELRITGDLNTRYDFNATGEGNRVYSGNNIATVVKSAPGLDPAGISTVFVTGIPATPNLVVRVNMLNNATNEIWVIDNVEILGN